MSKCQSGSLSRQRVEYLPGGIATSFVCCDLTGRQSHLCVHRSDICSALLAREEAIEKETIGRSGIASFGKRERGLENQRCRPGVVRRWIPGERGCAFARRRADCTQRGIEREIYVDVLTSTATPSCNTVRASA